MCFLFLWPVAHTVGLPQPLTPCPLSVMQRTGFYKDTSADFLCLRECIAWSELQLAVGRASGSGQCVGRMRIWFQAQLSRRPTRGASNKSLYFWGLKFIIYNGECSKH